MWRLGLDCGREQDPRQQEPRLAKLEGGGGCLRWPLAVPGDVANGNRCVPDTAAPWDAHPSASPSLLEVAPPIDSLSISLASSHMAPPPDLPLLPPPEAARDLVAGDGRKERSKSPQKAELWNLDPSSQGRRAAKEGGRSTDRGPRVQSGAEGEGGSEEARPPRSCRARSQERSAEGPGDPAPLPHTNGSSREEAAPRAREPERGPGESRLAPPGKSSSGGRKSTVSPGPWKIPGSDKLPSALRTGTSTLSR